MGERLVSGAATPDTWVVRGDSASRRTAGAEVAIAAEVAHAVAALARRVEQHRGVPQDIEWAVADTEPVLLQARPVVALPERPVAAVAVPVSPPPGYWTREDSHAPVPWTRFNRVLLGSRVAAVRSMCRELGLLFETIDFRDIGGWEYVRIVPLGGKDRPAPPARCPTPVPACPHAAASGQGVRVRHADGRPCGRLVRNWYEQWQPALADRIAMLREVDLQC